MSMQGIMRPSACLRSGRLMTQLPSASSRFVAEMHCVWHQLRGRPFPLSTLLGRRVLLLLVQGPIWRSMLPALAAF